MASASQQSLHLQLETDNETNVNNSTDLNDTWDYEDQSSMDISYVSKSKRTRSDSENSDSVERNLVKKHNITGSSIVSTIEYKKQNQNVNQNVIVFAQSRNVNLGKTNPIFVAKTINDLVGNVEKVINTQNGLKIVCNKSQANILSKEKRFGSYECIFSIKAVPKPNVKGITHGIPLQMKTAEIKEELQNANNIKIENINRLQKFDKIKNEKQDTESIIIEYGQDIDFPLHMYIGYKRITVKQFIPYPTRCFKCQKFGHVSSNCRGKLKCPNCSEEHEFENCDKKEIKKCSNCGGNHSAGYKGCLEFLKAKKIKEYSYSQKLSYAEATKQLKANVNTSTCTMKEQEDEQPKVNSEVNNEDHIITKVIEKVQTQSIENQESLVEKVIDKIQMQTKQNEKQFIDNILEQVESHTSEYEEQIIDRITEKVLLKTQNSCKCRMTPEAIFVFIIKAIKYFQDDHFLRKNSDNQLRNLAHVFKTCTFITLNHDKVYDILHL